MPELRSGGNALLGPPRQLHRPDARFAGGGVMSRKSAMSLYAKPEHKRMAKALGYALTLGDGHTWEGFSALAMARLDEKERVSLAWAAMMALDPDHVEPVASAVLDGAGIPLPSFFAKVMDDAAWWAGQASDDEIEAYCLATFTAMPGHRQAAFLEYVQGKAAA